MTASEEIFFKFTGGDGGQICYRRIQLSFALLPTLSRLVLFRLPLVGLLGASFASKRQKPKKKWELEVAFSKVAAFG